LNFSNLFYQDKPILNFATLIHSFKSSSKE
jgi:hypothetical protein